MRQWLDRLMIFGARRPRVTLALFAGLALAGAGVSLTLAPSSNINTLVSSSSADYRATQQDDRQFGGDAVDVLVRQPLADLISARNLGVLSQLEACLDGQEVVANQKLSAFLPLAPAKAKPDGGAGSPCGHLMATRPAQVVYGPATFLNQAVIAVNTQLDAVLASAEAAGGQALSNVEAQLSRVLASSGLTRSDLPSIDNPAFIKKVIFDSSRGPDTPKARFAYLFPTSRSALIQVRLRPNLSSRQTARAIHWIRQAVAMHRFALGSRGSYLVSGEPVVLSDVSATLSGQILALLIGSVLVMAIVLLLVFRQRRRLLPLGLALGAAAITFGLCAIAGGTLTLASIAVLPILIGLAVDYGIQIQSRASGVPTIVAAALATATGFLVLLLSPVPMVRGFGLLLVLGVAVALLVVLCAGSAALALPRLGVGWVAARVAPPELLMASLRGAREIVTPGWPRRSRSGRARGAAGAAGAGAGAAPPGADAGAAGAWTARLSRRPVTVLVIGLVLAAAGWAVDPQTSVQSDITKLVPRSLPALRDLHVLERTTGESGELDVLVHGGDVATPRTVAWMVTYEQAVVAHFGYSESTGCQTRAAAVCPALSLPDLFVSTTSGGSTGGLTQARINTLLAAVPAYFSQALINRDRTYATLSFGIKLMPLAKQTRVVDYMRRHLDPPAGVSARLAGLPLLSADAYVGLSSASRRLLILVAGLVAVALVLMAIFRRPRRALVPLVPIVLATGWSALVVWLIGIPLNPMSATLGALVIAISTEFSVLLSERFATQRAGGEEPARALANAYRSTGTAVLASGITAIAGFAVLILSNVTMLRDFGLVTLIDMSVSLLGVLAVLPAVLTLSESRQRVTA